MLMCVCVTVVAAKTIRGLDQIKHNFPFTFFGQKVLVKLRNLGNWGNRLNS